MNRVDTAGFTPMHPALRRVLILDVSDVHPSHALHWDACSRRAGIGGWILCLCSARRDEEQNDDAHDDRGVSTVKLSPIV